MKSFKKLVTVLMLVSFIFGAAAPAMAASAGIVKDSGFWHIGDTTNFAGYNWTLYKNDGTYGYIITSDVLDKTMIYGSSNVYKDSNLREVVSTNPDSYEAKMKSYSGTDMTWAEANGGSNNYIVKHDMTKTGTDPSNPATYESPYGGCGMTGAEPDLLYILSTAEAQALYKAGYGEGGDKNILAASNWYWLRSPGSSDNYAAIVCGTPSGTQDSGHIKDDGFTVSNNNFYVRPALQINLKSAIFEANLFKTTADGKGAVTAGGGFMLPEITNPAALTKQTKETLTFSGTPEANSTTTEVTEAVENRIGTDKVIDLTTPLLISKQLKVTYSGFGTTTDADHVAALVSTVSGSSEIYVNYAKLSTNTSETDLIVPTSNLANGTYNLYVFGEKIDGTHEDLDDTTTPVADAATRLVSAGSFTLSNTYTNSGTLAASHAAEGLTANLGGGFRLGFENAAYDTKINVGAGGANIAAEAGASAAELHLDNAEAKLLNDFTITDKLGGTGSVKGNALTLDGTAIDGTITAEKLKLQNANNLTGSLTVTEELSGTGNVTGDTLTLDGVTADGTITAEKLKLQNASSLTGSLTVTEELSGTGSVTGNALTLDGAAATGTITAEKLELLNANSLTGNLTITEELSGTGSLAAKSLTLDGAEAGGTITAEKLELLNANNLTGSLTVTDKLSGTGSVTGNALKLSSVTTEGSVTADKVEFTDGKSFVKGGTLTADKISFSNGGSFTTDQTLLVLGDTVALGKGASIGASNSVALGANSEATENNTISIGYAGGERKIVNVKAGENDTDAVNLKQMNDAIAAGGSSNAVVYGDTAKTTVTFGDGTNSTTLTHVAAGDILSADSTDAVNGGQLYATNQLVAGNAANITANAGKISTLETTVGNASSGLVKAVADVKADAVKTVSYDAATGKLTQTTINGTTTEIGTITGGGGGTDPQRRTLQRGQNKDRT